MKNKHLAILALSLLLVFSTVLSVTAPAHLPGEEDSTSTVEPRTASITLVLIASVALLVGVLALGTAPMFGAVSILFGLFLIILTLIGLV